MFKRILTAGMVSLFSVAAMANPAQKPIDFSEAFGGNASLPEALTESQLKETEGEWGWIIAAAVVAAVIAIRSHDDPNPTPEDCITCPEK